MKRFIRRAAYWLVRVIAVVIVLLIFFYTEEDWRGARAWSACQKELQKKGEILVLAELAPSGKPKDDLSKTPLFSELYEEYKGNHKEARIHHLAVDFGSTDGGLPPASGNYLQGKQIDLSAWQKFYRFNQNVKMVGPAGTPAQDVILALSQFDDELKEIDGAVSNPNAYWPVNYEIPAFGYLGGITSTMKIARVLQLKAVAHLENYQADLAQNDLSFCLRLNQPLTKCLFFVNYLVMAANQTFAREILWEGLHRHAWNDIQLHEIESALASTDMLSLAIRGMRTERASTLQTMRYLQTRNPKLPAEWNSENDPIVFLRYISLIRPSGWWNQDRGLYSLSTQKLIEALHPDRGTIDTAAFAPEDVDFEKSLWRCFYTPFSGIALPIDRRLGLNIAKTETYRRLARLGCRLEEYHLAHGAYPENLNELPDLPPHLNQEVVNEQPFHYQRKGDGYSLYSVGWDQKDDGGNLTRKGNQRDEGGTYNSTWDDNWPWPNP